MAMVLRQLRDALLRDVRAIPDLEIVSLTHPKGSVRAGQTRVTEQTRTTGTAIIPLDRQRHRAATTRRSAAEAVLGAVVPEAAVLVEEVDRVVDAPADLVVADNKDTVRFK